MHIVVGCAVDEEQLAGELLCQLDGRGERVALGVLFRRAHVALGVDGVVIVPIGRGSHGDAHLEGAFADTHAHQRVVSAEAPSPDGHP